MNSSEKLRHVQEQLTDNKIDGWLFYDFRRTNPLACTFLEIPLNQLLTRRFFYWLPKQGTPVKIIHCIEKHALDHLPGQSLEYCTWQELEACLAQVLKESDNIAMEYSPRNAIPYLSKVDAGTIELVRSFGVNVMSSGDLLQQYTSVWNEKKLRSHLSAAEVLDQTAAKTWSFIAENLAQGHQLTEYDVQQYMLEQFDRAGCLTDDPPICAVNAHSANPHYTPSKENSELIKMGDFILIDLWCKQSHTDAVYADITRVGIAATQPKERQREIFNVVKHAQTAATTFVKKHLEQKIPVKGCDVDDVCRQVIKDAGYEKYFIHRTGHNIDRSDHGDGANIDNFETQDVRKLLPGTCFSIEPGIYLPNEFGVRLEYDVYIHFDGRIQVTGGVQESITCLFNR